MEMNAQPAEHRSIRFGIILPPVLVTKVGVESAVHMYKARLREIDDRSAEFARAGYGDRPEYSELHQDRAAIYGELTRNPRFGYPKERADLEEKASRDRDKIEAVIGYFLRGLHEVSYLEAKRRAHEFFRGEGSETMPLSAEMREKGLERTLAALDEATALDRMRSIHLRRAIKREAA